MEGPDRQNLEMITVRPLAAGRLSERVPSAKPRNKSQIHFPNTPHKSQDITLPRNVASQIPTSFPHCEVRSYGSPLG